MAFTYLPPEASESLSNRLSTIFNQIAPCANLKLVDDLLSRSAHADPDMEGSILFDWETPAKKAGFNLAKRRDTGAYLVTYGQPGQETYLTDDKGTPEAAWQQACIDHNIEPLALKRLAGAYDAMKNLITVSLKWDHPTEALKQGAVLALRDMGMFTPDEWSVLATKAKNEWMKTYNTDFESEAIARAFADYRGHKAFEKPIEKLFDRMSQFFERTKNFLLGLGFQTSEDVFEKIVEGQIGHRTNIDHPDDEWNDDLRYGF